MPMAKNLRDCFPMLQSREDVLKKINGEEHLKKLTIHGKKKNKKHFLICVPEPGA